MPRKYAFTGFAAVVDHIPHCAVHSLWLKQHPSCKVFRGTVSVSFGEVFVTSFLNLLVIDSTLFLTKRSRSKVALFRYFNIATVLSDKKTFS